MHVESIDHFVLVVLDGRRSADFYSRVLGMDAKRQGANRWSLHFGDQKINLQQLHSSVDPLALRPSRGAGDFCLLTETPIEDVVGHLATHAVDIIDGPVTRNGATGVIRSVYFYDPDDNLIEISNRL